MVPELVRVHSMVPVLAQEHSMVPELDMALEQVHSTLQPYERRGVLSALPTIRHHHKNLHSLEEQEEERTLALEPSIHHNLYQTAWPATHQLQLGCLT